MSGFFKYYLGIGMLGTIPTFVLSWLSITSPSEPSRNAAITIRSTDGATVSLGVFRSCAQSNTSGFTCTPFKFKPTYDLSILGDGPPMAVIEATDPLLRGMAFFTTLASIFLLLQVSWIVFRKQFKCLMPSKGEEVPMLVVILILETITCFFGAMSFWLMYTFFDKTAQHFNVFAEDLGRPDLTASIGSSFLMAYIGYAMITAVWILTAMDIVQTIHGIKPKNAANAAKPPAPAAEKKPSTLKETLLDRIATSVSRTLSQALLGKAPDPKAAKKD